MPTKQEYENTLNELFGLSIKWGKLTKEDLASFVTLLSDSKLVADALGLTVKREGQHAAVRGAFVDGLIAGLVKRADSFDGPVVRAFKKTIENNI